MTDAGPSILRTKAALRAVVAQWRAEGAVIGVVPTMGALHEGHLSLVAAAKKRADRVVVTIFVNPRQFNNAGDLESYPRTEETDAALLAPFGVDAIYVPGPGEIYPGGFATTVSVDGLTDRWEGEYRPGHFDGVATVVAKLFVQTDADCAFFGEKDYQQLLVVRRMAADLDLKTQVVACPTLRERNGLAMSSRNLRLGDAARARAAALHAAMAGAADALARGAAFADARGEAVAALTDAGFIDVEYFALCDPATLEPIEAPVPDARILAAAWLDGVRLIDNIVVGGG